jgi:hypothetical protein
LDICDPRPTKSPSPKNPQQKTSNKKPSKKVFKKNLQKKLQKKDPKKPPTNCLSDSMQSLGERLFLAFPMPLSFLKGAPGAIWR